ncbi:MAG: hypothetical protein GYA33_02725 [Thermogutta sp.]|nr:hypothetical protein [Thermogutta sp.]
MSKRPSRTQPGPHRPIPPYPPIDPALTYPISRLRDWGFGARTVAAMQRQGLRTLRFGKWKFIKGSTLVAFLESASKADQDAPETREADR